MDSSTPQSSPKDFSWVAEGSTESQEVAAYYDQWAQTYDTTLAQWQYTAPQETARILGEYAPLTSRILDAGCGTGLTGKALQDQGYTRIVGLDISADSLTYAHQCGAYTELLHHDLQQQPFPCEPNSFDALVCIGVLAYIDDVLPLLREWCRLVRAGGYILFSQRTDLFAQHEYPRLLACLEREGLWQRVLISDPARYLPHNPDFGDRILVQYCLYQAC
ncbi:methyltransferase domain-containing protein [candidate division KSB3 bacterium]|uniref:Methyltransferase domain-containing protein n=1 Tax=candidate division KSB3 bacterium TaxID=2044937 RepID=A0A9D5Q6S0_9BACT|nr:methyltransferase domain-containing protein [candidate division KSB3 bacterium]MBD3326085.1 methyltransferase domain-containing protein [candidate division KSB3 bacterium]